MNLRRKRDSTKKSCRSLCRQHLAIFDYRYFISIPKNYDVYPETPIDYASSKIISGIKDLREGLDPDVLAYWYKRVEDRSKEAVPKHLRDKIHFEQDRVLWMKFKIDVSKRAVPYVMQVIQEYIPMMPYSTALYFTKVQEILTDEMNKELR